MTSLGNATSFERFCCSAKRFRRAQINDVNDLLRVTNTCFYDLNISFGAQLDIILDYAYGNTSYREEDCPVQAEICLTNSTPSQILYLCLWAVVLCTAIASNLTVITAVHKISYIRENVGNFLISSLAFSDLLVGVFIIPVKMKYAYNNSQLCSLNLCRFYITADTALFSISITNLLFISMDRLFALNFPYRYQATMTVKKCKYIIIAIWIYGTMWGLMSNVKWHDIGESSINIMNHQCMVDDNPIYVATIYVIVFYIPATIMLVIYYRIFCIATFHAKAIHKNGVKSLDRDTFVLEVPSSTCEQDDENSGALVNNNSGGYATTAATNWNVAASGGGGKETDSDCSTASTKKRASKIYTIIRQSKTIFKASKTVATTVLTFVVCWFPVSVYALVIAFSKNNKEKSQIKWFHVVFVDMFPLINSMLNPFIYAIMNKQYRRAFKSILIKFKRWLAQWFFFCL